MCIHCIVYELSKIFHLSLKDVKIILDQNFTIRSAPCIVNNDSLLKVCDSSIIGYISHGACVWIRGVAISKQVGLKQTIAM